MSATSGPFNVTAASLMKLGFAVPPSTSIAGLAISPAVQVAFEDSFGNPEPQESDPITIAIATGPMGATLLGTLTVSAQRGIASFADLSLDKPGMYTLSATAGTLNATSTTFQIMTGTPAKLVFQVQPANALGGLAIAPPVQVALQDASGNVLAADTTPINRD